MIANLAADENGVVNIPADAIAGLPLVHVVVSNPTTVLQRTVSQLPWRRSETVDLRLAKVTCHVDRNHWRFERAVIDRVPKINRSTLSDARYGPVAGLRSRLARLMKLYQDVGRVIRDLVRF